MRGRIGTRAAGSACTFASPGVDGALLVEAPLWEGDADGAWIEATTSGCSELYWLQLAKGRETSHPNDAVADDQADVERTLSRVNNGANRDPVSMLRVIKRVMHNSTVADGMLSDLAAPRIRHRAKRNFRKRLDAAKL